jgi:hypothetical protein
MKRKVAWARAYSAEQQSKVKLIAAEQRRMFRADGDDAKLYRRELALVRTVLEADATFQVVAVKDGRSPANRSHATRAFQRLDRAQRALIAFYDFDFDLATWRYRDPTLGDLMDARIDALIDRLQTTTEEG